MPKVTIIPASKPMFSVIAEPTKKRRVAGYARVSTDSDEQATSYDAQKKYYTEFIQKHADWEFVKVYADEGISGLGTKNRPGFNEMMNDALNGKIDLIITKSISRFARNTVDTLTAVRKLKEKNVEIWFEKENIQTFDGKGELLITIMSSLAQEESRSLSENVTWGKRKAAQDGKIYLPYARFLGYRRGADGLPEIIPEEQKIIEKIYDMFLLGMTPGGIARKLTEMGIKTPGDKDVWQYSTILSILTNEKYKGDAKLQKTFTVDFLTKKKKKNEGELPLIEVKESHPAIIDPVIFDRVQREIDRRKKIGRKYSGSDIFACRLICGDCGEFYGSKVWDSTSKNRHSVWQCNAKFRNKTKCLTPHLTDEQIKEKFLQAYNTLITDKERLLEDCRLMQETLTDCAEFETKADKLRTERELLEKLIREYIAKGGGELFGEYESRYNALTEKIQSLEKTIKDRNDRAAVIGGFMFAFHENGCELTEFDERLFIDVIDFATVKRSGEVVFKFLCGVEVAV